MGCNHDTGAKPGTLWISMIVTDTASYGQMSFLTWTQVRKLMWWARLMQVATSILSPGWPAPPELPAKCFQQRVSWKNLFLLNFFGGDMQLLADSQWWLGADRATCHYMKQWWSIFLRLFPNHTLAQSRRQDIIWTNNCFVCWDFGPHDLPIYCRINTAVTITLIDKATWQYMAICPI